MLGKYMKQVKTYIAKQYAAKKKVKTIEKIYLNNK